MNSPVSSEWIVKATHQYIAAHAKTHPEIAAFLETLDALPLYASWGGGVALRSDGELIGFPIKVETDPHLRFLAIVEGSKDHAELALLTPICSADYRELSIV